MSAFRAALRISRRDALRFKGRTALIMVMIGLPVLVITAALTSIATTQLTPQEKVPSLLGSADARLITLPFRTPVKQNYTGEAHEQRQARRSDRAWTPAEINTLLPGRLLRYQSSVVEARLADGYDRVDVLEVDLRDPLTNGMRHLVEGRLPAAPGEVAVSPEMIDRGVRIGGTVQVWRPDRAVRVVGVVQHPNRPGLREMVALPEGLLQHQNDGNSSGWLADTSGPVQRADIRRLNQAGLAVSSRAVIENPTQAELRRKSFDPEGPVRGLVSLGIAVVLIVMETALLAGPSFAVGLRRRRRELAVIAAQGASGPHLRTIVLADGLVLGGAAVLLGAAFGIGAGVLVESVSARTLDWTHGPVDVPWLQVAGVALLGVVSGLTAALVPAVQGSRQSPVHVLAGRAAVDTHGRTGRPLLGSALVALGIGGSFVAVRHGVLSVAASAAILVLGLVALMPWLVRSTGLLAARLPLPLRLSVRDGSRHRVRTASAAAAVMAATMAAVTVGIGLSSSYAQREEMRATVVPAGTVTIGRYDVDDQQWSTIRTAVTQALPGVELVPGQTAMNQHESTNLRVTWDPQACGKKRCAPPDAHSMPLPIGDERLLALLQGRHDPQAAAALKAGKAVVFDAELVRDGTLELVAESSDLNGATRNKKFKVPAVVSRAAEPAQTGALLPASAATAAGFTVAERLLYASYVPDDEERLDRDLSVVGGGVFVSVEKRFDDFLPTVLLMLLGAALVLVLGGTFAATGLAAADMRQDLDTMSAVGGAPVVRRLVVAAQAAYISGLGALTGLAGGLVSGVALTWPMTRTGYREPGAAFFDPGPTTIDIPWWFLAGIVVGLPLLAALVAGAFTRTRLVLARRVA
ncbi:putative ABC transport system permease protein [Nonomuraea polychroma]|uniref:Putative ABC transport system permease protein n=1 Tax=Nonomuraea polychroma TaxID=46176 RepID=A0A438MEP5_9ACTN|nr:FtsX-like permease family protein [Nonomuraea polychroma]RVX44270.1 putative ABC transport system permease protein [Nonomuraea polychroma]